MYCKRESRESVQLAHLDDDDDDDDVTAPLQQNEFSNISEQFYLGVIFISILSPGTVEYATCTSEEG